MGRPARLCIGSSIPTAQNSRGRSRVGWLARGPTFWLTPTSWRRCRCTPCGCGDGSSTSRRIGDGNLPPNGKAVQSGGATTHQGDAQPGGFEPNAKGRKCPGRFPNRRERSGAGPQCRAGRRRFDLGRDRQRRFQSAVEGGREAGGRARLREGCYSRVTAHIVVENARIDASRISQACPLSSSTRSPLVPFATPPRRCCAIRRLLRGNRR